MDVEEQPQNNPNPDPNSSSNPNSYKRFGLKNSIQTNFGDDYVFQIVPRYATFPFEPIFSLFSDQIQEKGAKFDSGSYTTCQYVRYFVKVFNLVSGFLLCLLVWESNKQLLNGFCVFFFFFFKFYFEGLICYVGFGWQGGLDGNGGVIINKCSEALLTSDWSVLWRVQGSL